MVTSWIRKAERSKENLTSIKTESQSSKRTLKVKLLINVETKSKETSTLIKVEESKLVRDLEECSSTRKEID